MYNFFPERVEIFVEEM